MKEKKEDRHFRTRPYRKYHIEEGKLIKPYYSTTELADLLGVHYNTIKNAIHEGRLQAQKVASSWVITKEDILEYIKLNNANERGNV